MIVSKKKPVEELLAMLEGVKKVALVGCGACASACAVGGEKECAEMKEFLEANGFEVAGFVIPDECCQKLLVKKDIKAFRDDGIEAYISLACGSGCQTVAENVDVPVYPANNTIFLGQTERVGIFNEMCRFCGDCVLGTTGGICPITKCAKSLVNGPCGGQKNGKCEVNPETDCAWIRIYVRLEELGQVEKLYAANNAKSFATQFWPRIVNTKEERK